MTGTEYLALRHSQTTGRGQKKRCGLLSNRKACKQCSEYMKKVRLTKGFPKGLILSCFLFISVRKQFKHRTYHSHMSYHPDKAVTSCRYLFQMPPYFFCAVNHPTFPQPTSLPSSLLTSSGLKSMLPFQTYLRIFTTKVCTHKQHSTVLFSICINDTQGNLPGFVVQE